jgi:hypothetical protein
MARGCRPAGDESRAPDGELDESAMVLYLGWSLFRQPIVLGVC